jgi:hypothetical protein
MLNVIRFLEKIGSEAQWNDIAMNKMELALAETDIEAPFRTAILNKDATHLQELMQQKPLICYVEPAEEDEEEGEDEPGEKDNAHRLSNFSFASRP